MINYEELWKGLYYKLNDNIKECETFDCTDGNYVYLTEKLIFNYMAEQVKQAENMEALNKSGF